MCVCVCYARRTTWRILNLRHNFLFPVPLFLSLSLSLPGPLSLSLSLPLPFPVPLSLSLSLSLVNPISCRFCLISSQLFQRIELHCRTKLLQILQKIIVNCHMKLGHSPSSPPILLSNPICHGITALRFDNHHFSWRVPAD